MKRLRISELTKYLGLVLGSEEAVAKAAAMSAELSRAAKHA